MRPAFFDLIHSAYEFETPLETWLDRIAECAAKVVPGNGTVVYAYDASRPEDGIEILGASRADLSDEFYEATLELNRLTRPEEARAIYHRGVINSTVSEVMEHAQGMADSTYGKLVGSISPDTWGLSASDPTHRGIAMNAPLDEPTRIRESTRMNWMRVGVHLNAAWRIRRRLEESQKLNRSASSDAGLLGLFDRAVEQRRRAHESERVDEGLAVWQALLDGKWTLVERIDEDEKRHYVLIENDYGLVEPAGLTNREREVVSHAVQGESYKWIAYQLGVTVGTVSTLLSRATAKLGVDSKRELVWLYQQVQKGE